MMLKHPFLAKCTNRNIKAKVNPIGQNPNDWFSSHLLEKNNLIGITFDFFVDWSKKEIKPVFWLKSILKDGISYASLLHKLEDELLSLFGFDQIYALAKFADKFDVKAEVLVIDDALDWNLIDSEILRIPIDFILKKHNPIPVLQKITNFKNDIKINSGGSVRIGSKGLFYGTSSLECFLSKTDSLYPGDVDLLLLNSHFEPFAILEYKKHNLNTPIENQRLSNYYPKPDRRKYNRLAILRDFLSKKGSIPLLNIYYPTNYQILKGKVELVVGEIDTLKTKANGYFDKTITSDKENSAFYNVLAGVKHFHLNNK